MNKSPVMCGACFYFGGIKYSHAKANKCGTASTENTITKVSKTLIPNSLSIYLQ